MFFGDSAYQVNETIDPRELSPESAYIGLEHIEQETLQLAEIGTASKVTSNKRIFKKGDILFGKLRPYFRKVIITDFDGICSTDIWVIRPQKSIDNKFLYYWCADWKFINFVNSASEGTRMPRAKWEVAINHEIPNHTYENQKVIGNILSSLDEKIKINKKTNETLEGIAKALFKSWFIDFDPVRAKVEGRSTGLPDEISELFPDSFEDIDSGEIPIGWEVAKLGDVVSIQYGKNFPTKNLLESGFPVFGGNGIIGYHSSFLYQDEMTLMSCRGAASGDIVRSLPESFVTNNSLIMNHILGNFPSQRYVQYFLESKDRSIFVTGSAQPQVTIDSIYDFAFLVPNLSLVKLFQHEITPITKRSLLLDEQNQTLATLRNILIPKLISGELRVPDAEKMLEEVGI